MDSIKIQHYILDQRILNSDQQSRRTKCFTLRDTVKEWTICYIWIPTRYYLACNDDLLSNPYICRQYRSAQPKEMIWKENLFPLYSCIVFNRIWLTLTCFSCILKLMQKWIKRGVFKQGKLRESLLRLHPIQWTMKTQKRWSQSTDALFWRKWCERIGRRGAAWPAQRPEYTFQPDPGWQKT